MHDAGGLLAAAFGALTGCATFITGPNQDVLIDSNPPGAKATVSGMLSERGPNFIDKEKHVVTTPATVRLRRTTPTASRSSTKGTRSGTTRSSAGTIGSCRRWSAECPARRSARFRLRHEGASTAGRFLEAAFYEYPVGAFRAIGKALRLISPEAIIGTSFKLKAKDADYWYDWTGTGVPRVTTTLEPISLSRPAGIALRCRRDVR